MSKRGRLLPEHLFQIVVDHEVNRPQDSRRPAARFSPSQRIWVEPVFNLIGQLIGRLILLLPWPTVGRVHLWCNRKMTGHPPEDNPQLPARTVEILSLARSLNQKTGHWPVVLMGTSHPDTTGPTAWLRFEVLRQALLIAGALVDAAPPEKPRVPPQCFLAIDPFALGTVSVPVQALYAGFMHAQYLVWDRQASTQSWLQKKILLQDTGHSRIGWRLLKALQKNPVIMVISGGLPANARLFYAAREFIAELHLSAWPMSRREAQRRLMSILKEPVDGRYPADEGIVLPETQRKLEALFMALGVSGERVKTELDRFAREFEREIPSRPRLWRVLAGRFVKKGVPVIFIPLTHRDASPHVQIGDPMILEAVPADLEAWSEQAADRFKEAL